MNIYQVFTRLFRVDEGMNIPFGTIKENGCSKFNHFTVKALNEFVKLGITHVWFTGVIRHASCTKYVEYALLPDNPRIVKGVAGSPYAIKDYFDVDPDLSENIPNRMDEFEQLVKRCHDVGLKVIIDFVPNHVSRNYFSQKLPLGVSNIGSDDIASKQFNVNNNYYYVGKRLTLPDKINFPYTIDSEEYIEEPAKATGNDVFKSKPSINDWYETVKLNYGVNYKNGSSHFNPIPDTWHKMLDILLFWAKKGIDAFRVDMAEMVPVEFWNWAIANVKQHYPELLFMGEVYNPQQYRNFIFHGGFDFLYDKEQFYNFMREIITNRGSAKLLTDCWWKQEGLDRYLVRFLENHDEQRIASKYFCNNPFHAQPAMVVAATMHRGPLMIYFGQEIGEKAADNEGFSGSDGRTTIFDYWRIEDYQKWVNYGKFSVNNLSDKQQKLRKFYSDLLNLRQEYRQILDSSFFDLMYVNQNNLDIDKIFAYLRYFGHNILLIVANFDCNKKHSFRLNFPEHAFEVMGLDRSRALKIKGIFCNNNTIETSVNELITSGLQIDIDKHTAHIFQISIE